MTARRLLLVTAGSVIRAAKEAAQAGTENGRCRGEWGERGGTLATSSNSPCKILNREATAGSRAVPINDERARMGGKTSNS